MNRAMSLAGRLAVDVIPEPMSGCHLWIGAVERKGYGRFQHDGTRYWSHRVAYELKYGPLPAGLMVCHKCDNPPCVNPDHLFAGDNTANVRDCAAKGRLHAQKRTTCRRGHPLDDVRWNHGKLIRRCFECERAQEKTRKHLIHGAAAPRSAGNREAANV